MLGEARETTSFELRIIRTVCGLGMNRRCTFNEISFSSGHGEVRHWKKRVQVCYSSKRLRPLSLRLVQGRDFFPTLLDENVGCSISKGRLLSLSRATRKNTTFKLILRRIDGAHRTVDPAASTIELIRTDRSAVVLSPLRRAPTTAAV